MYVRLDFSPYFLPQLLLPPAPLRLLCVLYHHVL
nr:MAG TPA: hypothetical protein [Caudoviricetes sp.]